jgi:hypothetical protein
MPSSSVHGFFNDGVDRGRYMICIPFIDEGKYLERWDLLSTALAESAA